MEREGAGSSGAGAGGGMRVGSTGVLGVGEGVGGGTVATSVALPPGWVVRI